jgi:hypothetical protein
MISGACRCAQAQLAGASRSDFPRPPQHSGLECGSQQTSSVAGEQQARSAACRS